MLNLRALDLNLLPIFEAAYEEKSLSRAATRLAYEHLGLQAKAAAPSAQKPLFD